MIKACKKIIKVSVVLALVFSMVTLKNVNAAETTNNAKIGDQIFESLDAAMNAAGETDVIELLDDATITVATITKPIIINGNGYTVNVPKQNTDSGGLAINNLLEFRNTKILFNNSTNWSATINGQGVLGLYEGSVCEFEYTGIYSSPNGTVNVDESKMILKDMQYTSMMGEAYARLNITNGSEFVIESPMNINGITGFDIRVDASTLSVTGCNRQGLVMSNLILTNGAVANISQNRTGYNMFGGNTLLVNAGTTLTMNDNSSMALMTQGNQETSITVKDGGTFIAQRNGEAWRASDDEAKYYATKGAIVVGAYGWYETYNQVLVYRNDVVTFEDGAYVNISDNYTRGISNFGTTYIGNTTVIKNNGALKDGETKEDIRVAHGGGIYNHNSLTVALGAEIYNNHANSAGDDIYNTQRGYVDLCAVGNDWILDDCHDLINGWYEDGINETGQRWQADAENETDNYYVENTDGQFEGLTALKAAHDKKFEVTYDLQGGTSLENTDPASYVSGASVQVISNPTRDGYTFEGWTISTDNSDTETPVVTDSQFVMPKANVHLVAVWEEVMSDEPTEETPVEDEVLGDDEVPEDEVLGDKEEPETAGVDTADEDEVLGDTVAPDTGDTTQLELLAVTMMMGAMGFVALKKRKEL